MYIQLPIGVFRILGQDKKVSSEYFIQILTELAAKLLKQRLNRLQLLTAASSAFAWGDMPSGRVSLLR